MSNQNVSKTILEYEVDQSSVRKAVKSSDTVEQSIDDITKAVKNLNDEELPWKRQAKEIREVNEEAKDLNNTLKGTQKNLSGMRGGADIDIGGRFGTTASRAAQGRGALEALGAGGAGPILEVTEAFADLGEIAADSGIGVDKIKGALGSLGLAGIAAGVAITGAAVAFKFATDAIRKEAEAQKQIVSAREEVNELVIKGDRAALEERKRIAEENIEIQKRNLEEAKKAQEKADKGLQISDFLDPFIETAEDVEAEAVKSAEKRIAEEQRVIDEIEKSWNEVSDNVSESAPALEEVADVTVQEVIPATEDYTKAIKQSATAATTSASKIDDFNRNATASMEQLLDSSDDASDAIEDASKDMKESAQDIKRTLTDDLIDIEADIAQERSEIIRDANREDLQAQRDANQELKNIRRDGLRSERDAARERNFLALAESRESTREALADEAEAEKVRRDERQIALENELTDLRLSAELTRQERMKEFARANRDLKIDFNRQLNAIKDSRKAEFDMVKFVLDQQNKLVEQQSKRRLEIERQTAEAVNDLWSQVGSRVGGSMRRGNAGGGVSSAMRSLGFFD